jgi:hypothetical protein
VIDDEGLVEKLHTGLRLAVSETAAEGPNPRLLTHIGRDIGGET